jgi:hypothetical protein
MTRSTLLARGDVAWSLPLSEQAEIKTHIPADQEANPYFIDERSTEAVAKSRTIASCSRCSAYGDEARAAMILGMRVLPFFVLEECC